MVADGGSLSALGYFLPIFAFLLVFVVVFALLKKTGVLGASNAIVLFVSFIVASFFIIEASLVEFVQFSSAGFAVAMIIVFFLVALTAFVPGGGDTFLSKKSWFALVVFGLLTGFFVISSSYVFNWSINWLTLKEWAQTSWFGMILLLVIAGIVSFVISRGGVPTPTG